MSNTFTSVAPYHILSYGTLLGTTVWHSFINGPVLYNAIDRPAFSKAQIALFPIYFGIQTALPLVLALSYPGNHLTNLSNGVSGALDVSRRWDTLLPLGTMFVTGLANLLVLLPVTNSVMKERRGQVKRDGKEYYDEGPHSQEMKTLNKRFGVVHGISSLLNMATLVSVVAYGFTLGSRLSTALAPI